MGRKQWLRSVHQVQQSIRAVALGHIALNLLVGDVVRRRGLHLFLAVPPNHEMPVAHPRKKLDAVAAENPAKIADNLGRLLGGNVSAGKIFHHGIGAAAANRDQIAAKGNIGRPECHAHARRLERRAAGVIHGRVITHNAHVANVAAGRKPFGNHMGDAVNTVLRKPIHIRRARRLERRLAAEHVEGIVGHAITLQNDIFHFRYVTFGQSGLFLEKALRRKVFKN